VVVLNVSSCKGAAVAAAAGAEFMGKKTTVRMFNRLRGRQLAGGPRPPGGVGRGKEDWLFWYASSPEFFQVGPGSYYCSPRHRAPFNSINEPSKRVCRGSASPKP